MVVVKPLDTRRRSEHCENHSRAGLPDRGAFLGRFRLGLLCVGDSLVQACSGDFHIGAGRPRFVPDLETAFNPYNAS